MVRTQTRVHCTFWCTTDIGVVRLTGVFIAAADHRTVALVTTDIVGFTALSAAIGAEEVVMMLDALYFRFDHIVLRTMCYKVETIGDGARAARCCETMLLTFPCGRSVHRVRGGA